MSLLSSILLGFIQGLTEFLPVSSSGHLAIAEHLLGMSGASDIPEFFDVLLHLGTLVAVFVAYWAEVRDMVLEFFRGAKDLAHGTTPTPIPPGAPDDLIDYCGNPAAVCSAPDQGSGGGPGG